MSLQTLFRLLFFSVAALFADHHRGGSLAAGGTIRGALRAAPAVTFAHGAYLNSPMKKPAMKISTLTTATII